MAREAKQEYRYHEDGAIALYRRPNSAMWYARCKLDDGVALNMGTSPEMIHRHYGHDNTRSRAAEFTNVWLTEEDEE